MRDEFNKLKVTNEDKNPDFEFGNTPKDESESYFENSDNLRDEINDDNSSNGDKPKKDEQKKEKKRQSSNNNNGGKGKSLGTSITTVVGASLISITTLSTLVGINLFFTTKCEKKNIAPHMSSIEYDFEISGSNKDNVIVSLYNEEYEYNEEQELFDGANIGMFDDLASETTYLMQVIDITYNNTLLFSEEITTRTSDIAYTVTFYTNSDSRIESQEVLEGGYAKAPEDPTKEGYTFTGWYTEEDLVNKYNFRTPVNDDLDLFAGWKEFVPDPSKMCTLSFKPNGGTGVMNDIVVEKGTKLYLPDCTFTPPDETQMFDKWRIDSPTGTGVPLTWEFTVNKNCVFYATWMDDTRYTVTFEANGGTGEMSIDKTFGPEYITPVCQFIPPENYKFDYWYVLNGEAGNKYKEGSKMMITSDITLVASWAPDASLSFHVDYIDTMSESPTNLMQFTYSFTDEYSMYEEFKISFNTFYGSDFALEIGIGATDDVTTDTLDLSSYASRFTSDEVVSYTIYGYHYDDQEQHEYELYDGSFSNKQIQKERFDGIYIGKELAVDNGTYEFITMGGKAYLPIKLDMSDYNQETYGNALSLRLEKTGDTPQVIDLNLTNGMSYVIFKNNDQSSITFDSIQVLGVTGKAFVSLSSITLNESTSNTFYGFNIDESSLFDGDNNISVNLVGNAVNGDTFGDLTNIYTYMITFRPRSTDGSVYYLGDEIKFEMPFEPSSSTKLDEYINLECEDIDELIRFMKRYAFEIELSYYDNDLNSYIYITTYSNVCF